MCRFLFALPLLAASLATAQNPTFTLKRVYPLGQPQVGRMNVWSCPVGMTAEQQATGATQWVVSLEDTRNPPRIPPGKMGVHVTLKAAKDSPFREAKVGVTYQVPPSGAMLVAGEQASTASKTFDLVAGDDPAADLESSLLIGSGVSITRVKLLSLTYADGTVWHPGTEYNCTVRVSHLLRVATAH